MKIAVLSLTMNRLAYTQHCFDSLNGLAGCGFDHFVLDQGSTDGTVEWLEEEQREGYLIADLWTSNLGIHRGMNKLLDLAGPGYDVYVKMDNDCELTVPGTLDAVCGVHLADPRSMVGPVVQGLRGPMLLGQRLRIPGLIRGGPEGIFFNVARTPMIGGIMQPIPHGWRYDETLPPWGGDDDQLSAQAEWCGQLLDFPVNHYRTTDGQHDDFPGYFAERVAAGGPA